MENLVTFWKNKKVFLTGHTGFKGSWLTLWLKSLGAEVTGFSLPPPTPLNLFTIANIATDITDIRGDIRDQAALLRALQHAEPDIVFHLAAQPLVRHAYQYPVETYATNVMGTVHLLEAARHTDSVRVILNITTDKCYENKEWPWGYRENEPMGGHDPYSNSKGCAELVTSAYRQSFFPAKTGVGLASVRAGNVIGGGDWAVDRLIPDMVTSFQENKTVTIRYPNATRPWQHVLEPLSGYLKLAEVLFHDPNNFSEGWNFGPHEEDAKTVSYLADQITTLWGKNARWKKTSQQTLHAAHYLKLDCSKAKSLLNWQPRWRLDHALAETIKWYQHYYDNQDMRQLSLNQINTYSNTSLLRK